MAIRQFPSPLEYKIFDIMINTHVAKFERQIRPLLRTNEITKDTVLPVVVPLVIQRRRSQDKETMEVDMIITIWDVFKGLDTVKTMHEVEMAAIAHSNSYQNDLMFVIDELEETGDFYNFVEDQIFTPSYKIDAFEKFLEGSQHPFRELLFGASVLFTLRGPTECIQCAPIMNDLDGC